MRGSSLPRKQEAFLRNHRRRGWLITGLGAQRSWEEALQKLSGVPRHPNGTRAGGNRPLWQGGAAKEEARLAPQPSTRSGVLPARFPGAQRVSYSSFLDAATTRLPSETIVPQALQTR